MKVLPIKNYETHPWLLKKHYAKRIPSISYAFGLYEQDKLIGVVTFGMPASPFLCIGVCGEQNKNFVLELNRLCLMQNKKNQAIFLIANSIKLLPKPRIIVSYADTDMNHVGYVYQATNFLFTGTTQERTDMAGEDGKHSRHNFGDSANRVNRSAKHRYVFLHGTKRQKKDLLKELNYSVQPYPKGDSVQYNAGGDVPVQNLLFA